MYKSHDLLKKFTEQFRVHESAHKLHTTIFLCHLFLPHPFTTSHHHLKWHLLLINVRVCSTWYFSDEGWSPKCNLDDEIIVKLLLPEWHIPPACLSFDCTNKWVGVSGRYDTGFWLHICTTIFVENNIFSKRILSRIHHKISLKMYLI